MHLIKLGSLNTYFLHLLQTNFHTKITTNPQTNPSTNYYIGNSYYRDGIVHVIQYFGTVFWKQYEKKKTTM